MKRLATLFLSVALFLVSAELMADGQDSGYEKQNVVYHINYDDPKKQKGAMRNVQKHINAVGKENLELQIVCMAIA